MFTSQVPNLGFHIFQGPHYSVAWAFTYYNHVKQENDRVLLRVNTKETKTRSVHSTFTNSLAESDEPTTYSTHPTYPFPIPTLPSTISRELGSLPARPGRAINDQPGLDLLYFQPFVPSYLAKPLFHFLRSQLPFYRVEYTIKRSGVETQIKTPRFTTVFGIDETSHFASDGSIVDAKTNRPVTGPYGQYPPRPIPKCLDGLRVVTEAATGCKFNFCLVNYYASGNDSISYHSDDERFLGPEPAIASFSLGAARDFLMKHKPPPPPPTEKPARLGPDGEEAGQQGKGEGGGGQGRLKLPLASGDMVLMRGRTQSNWLHSIPKRTGKNSSAHDGRINITFRRAMVKGGTDNYYNYNVGTGAAHKWDEQTKEMKVVRQGKN